MPILYVDLISEASRACVIFCRLNRLPIEIKFISIRKGEHRIPELLKLNPLAKVPFLVDGDDFVVPESCAILTYLSKKYNVSDNWYPSDLRQRTKIDTVLHWQQKTLRVASDKLVFDSVLSQQPTVQRSLPPVSLARSEAAAKENVKVVVDALSQLENCWLASSEYVGGSTISIADLVCGCILEQLRLIDSSCRGPDLVDLLAAFPKIRSWLDRVETQCGPHFKDVHGTLKSAVARAQLLRKDRRTDDVRHSSLLVTVR